MSKSTFFAVAAMAFGASAQLFPANSSSSAILAGATGPSSTGSILTSSLLTSPSTSSAAGGIASAIPTNGTTLAPSSSSAYSNATSILPATSTASGSAAPTASDPVFCPTLSGDIYLGPLDVTYRIGCDVSRGGLLIDVTIAPAAGVAKRQTTDPTTLQSCLQICSGLPQCVATAFDTNNPQCFFYSSLDSAFTANGIEFATVISRNATTSATFTPSSTGFANATASSTAGPFATGNATASATGLSTGVSSLASSTGSSSVTSSASATATAKVDLFCPNLDAQIFVDPSGIQFLIECGLNHVGIIIDVTLTVKKRQAVAPTSLADCLTLCAATTGCVGTGFNTAQGSCTLFSSIGAAYSDLDVEFGVVVAPAAVVTPGQTVTSAIYSTNIQTISSCAPTVTDCPLANGVSVITEVIPVSSTVYICPTLTTIPAVPVACTACPYAAVTATAYSQTVETIYSCAPDVTNCPYNVATSFVPASTAVVVATTNAAGSTVTVTAAAGTNAAGAGSNFYVTEVVTSTVTTCPVGYTLTTAGTTTVLTAPSVVTTAVNVQSTVYADVTVTATGVILESSAAASSGVVVVSSAGASSGVVVVASSAVFVSSGVTSTGVVVVSSAVPAASAGASSGAAVASSQSGVAVITTTKVVAGPTVVINYPVPTSTGAQATAAPSVVTSTGSGSGATVSTQAGSSATTTGVLAFTGAANSLVGPAGMAGAVVAAVAFLL